MSGLVVLRAYAPGDAGSIPMDEPCPERLLTGMPLGRAFTAIEMADGGAPIACLGWHDTGEELRVWARTKEGLGHSQLRQIWSFARDLLGTVSDRTLVCTAGSPVTMKLFARFGFCPASKMTSFPAVLTREAS